MNGGRKMCKTYRYKENDRIKKLKTRSKNSYYRPTETRIGTNNTTDYGRTNKNVESMNDCLDRKSCTEFDIKYGSIPRSPVAHDFANRNTEVPILVDLIGARQLPKSNLETFCVVQYGSRTIHRTKVFAPKEPKTAHLTRAVRINGLLGSASWQKVIEKSLQNPIWSVRERSLFAVDITKKDIKKNKDLVITVWGRHREKVTRHAVGAVTKVGSVTKADTLIRKDKRRNSDPAQFVGLIRITSKEILESCYANGEEYRHELRLVDRSGTAITRKASDEQSMLAFRCRVATFSDLNFVRQWNSKKSKNLEQLWKEADILQPTNVPMVTELPESDVQGNVVSEVISHGIKLAATGVQVGIFGTTTTGTAVVQGGKLTTAAAGTIASTSKTAIRKTASMTSEIPLLNQTVSGGAKLTTGVASVAIAPVAKLTTGAAKGATGAAKGAFTQGASITNAVAGTITSTSKAAVQKTSKVHKSKIAKGISKNMPKLGIGKVVKKTIDDIGVEKNLHMLLSDKVWVKPYPDPEREDKSKYMTEEELKAATLLPSRKWVHAGSKEKGFGRLHIEILSAHKLPNVDLGGAKIGGKEVGNLTDAFCAVVYGDAMVQTDLIDDELSPHWPPWTQRAFVFNVQHPSHVVYLGVFGYKRLPLQHKPVGRIEINPLHLQHNTLYNLEYNLCLSSHGKDRTGRGRIRLRIRLDVEDERKVLLAALKPPPPVHLNVTKNKSLQVARYTVCGEYDDGEKFSLNVLKAYIDEIVDGYVQRLLYGLQDGVNSLIFWRDQANIFGFAIPVYSMIMFVLGILAVERPRLIPSIFSFTLALFMLAQMGKRMDNPSPWRRCFPFFHYLRILITGKSVTQYNSISANEGFDEMTVKEEAYRKRVQQDKEFLEKKSALEKEVEEVEKNDKIETSKSEIIPLELLVVLGKVQGIVGDVCRVCRCVDAILTWEYSNLDFFITFGLLLVSFVFLFLPWDILYRWIGRVVVLLLLGPQNRLIDRRLNCGPSDDNVKLKKLYEERMLKARLKQEETMKMKHFRKVLFGKFSTQVPSVLWTPHDDHPLPCSTAQIEDGVGLIDETSEVAGQQLHGRMIPRPEDAWKRNQQEFNQGKDSLKAAYPTKKGRQGGGKQKRISFNLSDLRISDCNGSNGNDDSTTVFDMPDVDVFEEDSDTDSDTPIADIKKRKSKMFRVLSRLVRKKKN